MAAFESGNYNNPSTTGLFAPKQKNAANAPALAAEDTKTEETATLGAALPNPIITEPIMVLKIYDSCRHRNCLTRAQLGPILDEDDAVVQADSTVSSVSVESMVADIAHM